MKRRVCQLVMVLLLGFAVDLCANPLGSIKKENYDRVVDNITAQVIEALPDDIHVRLLAIGPVGGDDGTFVNKLTEQIKAKTKFHLIERHDLTKLLEEQGIQLSLISDERSPVEPGKIKGVEALIMAKFEQKISYFFFSKADIFVKMDNVETGDIIFAKNFKAQYVSPKGRWIIAGFIAILLIFIFLFGVKKQKKNKTELFVENDDKAQINFTNELKKAKDNLNRVHDTLVADKHMELSTQVMDANLNLKNLIIKIEQTPGFRSDFITSIDKKNMVSTAKSMKGLVKNVLAESEKLYSTVSNKNFSNIESIIDRLQGEIKNCTNRFQERTIGRI